MDASILEYLKGTSLVSIIVIVGATLWAVRWLREAQKGDVSDQVRLNLGLRENENFDAKLNAAIAAGFSSAVHPLTESIANLATTIGALSAEVKGLREGLTNHGEQIARLKERIAVLERGSR